MLTPLVYTELVYGEGIQKHPLVFGSYLGFNEGVIQHLNTPISVDLISSHKTGRVLPRSFWWAGRLYPIEKVGLHHTYRVGRTLFHVFSVIGGQTCFRLSLNTDTLHWQLEEISDD